MKRPEDIQASKIQEEKSKSLANQKSLENMLSSAVDAAAKDGGLTSQGGIVKVDNFNKENESLAVAYFQKYGWEAQYIVITTSWYSMTTKSEGYYTKHTFNLKPLPK